MIFSAPFLTELLRTILIMSISGSIVALLLFLIKPFVRRRLPKYAQYYMCLVALATLLIPLSKIIVLPNTNAGIPITPIYHVVENVILSNESEQESIKLVYDPIHDMYVAPPESEAATLEKQSGLWVTLGTIFLYVYPLVAVFIILYGIISYLYFVRRIRRCPKIALPTELYALEELKGRQHPRIYRSAFAEVPMLTGLFKPSIVLPDHEYTNEHLRFILLHELTHLRQYDVVFKWLSLIVCAVHWFNPVAWIMRHEIDRIAELSCDENVICNMDNNEKQGYGDMLIMVAAHSTSRPSAVLSTTLCEDKKVLKERLAAIMQSRKHTKAGFAVSTAVVFVMACAACVLGAAGATPYTEAPSEVLDIYGLPAQRIIRESEHYYAAIDKFAFSIQAYGDPNFIPPARAVFSFVGALDEIREWEAAEERSITAKTLLGFEPLPYIDYLVIDLYDENDNLTQSTLHNTKMYVDVYDADLDAFIPRHYLQPDIHEVWFIGTHKELWELGTTDISKPSDLYPVVFTTGCSLYDGNRALGSPDDWDLDAIVSAEFAICGNFTELMGFWGYTEKELRDEMNHSAPVGSYNEANVRINDPFVFYVVIEYLDAARNLVGREFMKIAGDRPEPQLFENMHIQFLKTVDEYEAWLNQN